MAIEYQVQEDGDRGYRFGLQGDGHDSQPGEVDEWTDNHGNPTLIIRETGNRFRNLTVSVMEAADLWPLLKHFAGTGRLPEPVKPAPPDDASPSAPGPPTATGPRGES